MRGRFITFEGGEGTGKSTQVARLARRLEKAGRTVVTTREPGGSPGAEIVRHVLLSGAAEALGPDAEAMLFAAARADHIAATIAPALERGDWVISDRFYDSSRVYQGIGGNVEPELIASLERVTVADTLPDLTIVLDVPAHEGLARAAHRRAKEGETVDRFEKEAVATHERLRQGFLAIAAAEPERVVVVDAGKPVGEVEDAIWRIVSGRLTTAE